ncbi:hypothetical protein Mgra_00006927 [Meloidogyne graminicola]|uniref:Uncharacterized protein n=1 Tax=Meloidogyne graminicola TaxID=189291 RepID=A0A8S9ZJZ2_9BILA|nr:hypothetical protein Mgra_00006927 [Meloidogyne graminicola]
MIESSSNADFDIEDSFTNLSDLQISFTSECSESKKSMHSPNAYKFEEIQNKLMSETIKNDLLKEKVEQLENKLTNDLQEVNLGLDKRIEYFTLEVNKHICIIYSSCNKRIFELEYELKQLKEGKRVCFENVENKWKFINKDFPCCDNKCVNTENPNGLCIKGNGYIQIKSDTNIEYIKSTDENIKFLLEYNDAAIITTENSFNKPKENSLQCCLNCTINKLFYYEINVQFEKKDFIRVLAYCVKKKLYRIFLPSFSFNNNDIIGCGLVYPFNNKLPYVFFTHNGTQIVD